MEHININCKQRNGYYESIIASDEIDEPVEVHAMDSMESVAIATLQYLMKTGKVQLSINEKLVEPEGEDGYNLFFEEGDWPYHHDV